MVANDTAKSRWTEAARTDARTFSIGANGDLPYRVGIGDALASIEPLQSWHTI